MELVRKRNVTSSATSSEQSSPRADSQQTFEEDEDDIQLLDGTNPTDYIYSNSNDIQSLGVLVAGSTDQRLTLMDEVMLLGLRDQKGYLSFLNDSISYVLRGCIIMELGLRRKIRLAKFNSTTSMTPISCYSRRHVQVIDDSQTGEILLDEAIAAMKRESHSIGTWMDLLSGETWNPIKISFQIKQVRERIAKGLVDKGVLRTDKQSFYLFDMATHPLRSQQTRNDLINRVIDVCLGRGSPPTLRTIALITAAISANVLDNAIEMLSSQDRTVAVDRAEQLLRIYSSPSDSSMALPSPNQVIAGVLTVFLRLDSIVY